MKDWVDLALTGEEKPVRGAGGEVLALVGHVWGNKQRDPPAPGDLVVAKGVGIIRVAALCAIQADANPRGGEPFAFLGVRGSVVKPLAHRGDVKEHDRVFLTPNEVGETVLEA